MDNSTQTSVWGMVVILMGLAMALWGLRLLHKPVSLHPDSYMYRYIYYRFFAWRRRDMESSPKLTDRQIRLYAIVTALIGICVVMTGVIVIRG